MKTKIHIFYGIVIGILLCSSFGSIKKDKAEFESEMLIHSKGTQEMNEKLRDAKKHGYTIISIQVEYFGNMGGGIYAHLGK